jgi:F-type H+-transporting ATPase subunit delta
VNLWRSPFASQDIHNRARVSDIIAPDISSRSRRRGSLAASASACAAGRQLAGGASVSVRSVARQYAQALFQVADRSQRQDAIGRDLEALMQVVDSHAELRAVFETPLVGPRKKRALVDALIAAAPDLGPEIGRLLELLAERDRLMLLGDIARAYRERVMAADRMVAADVTTALPMGEERRASLAQALGKATGQTVTISTRVDPAILGGVVARVGSLVFDGSVVRQVERLRQRLLAEA